MWKPVINTHGKAYGQSPYSAQAAYNAAQLQQAQIQQSISQLQNNIMMSLGGNNVTTLSGASSGVSYIVTYGNVPVTISSVPVVNGTITFERTEQQMPFTLDKIEKLKSIEPRKVEKPKESIVNKLPDYIEPIVAWRAWGVTGNLLKSLGREHFWHPKTKESAVCLYGNPHRDGKHEAPQSNCTCGVWSFKSLESLLLAISSYSAVAAIGQVSLWGKIIETENGYRAQYAYPKELWVLDEKHTEIAYNYNVPVRVYHG